MENSTAVLCPKGGEHEFQTMTGFWSGNFCIKCWQEEGKNPGKALTTVADQDPRHGIHPYDVLTYGTRVDE